MKKGLLSLGLLLLVAASLLNSCSKEVSGTDPHLLEDPQLGVGKWKIKKRKVGTAVGKKNETCEITEIIFRSDGVFKIYFGNTFIQGNYAITGETTIELSQESTELGQMTNVVISNGNISFSIQLINICSDTLEGEKDETYNESLSFIPDDQFEQALIELGIDDTLDDYVTTDAIASIKELNLSNLGIQNLSGIEDFAALEVLVADNNEIENANLNELAQLERIDLHNNRLAGIIDLSDMPSLRYVSIACNNSCSVNNPEGVGVEQLNITDSNNLIVLNVASNDLGYLDTREKGNLEELNINDNDFGELFIANNTNLTWLDASGNSNLICILANSDQINRPIDCENSETDITYWCYDAEVSTMAEDCEEVINPTVAIPDPNFEQGLIDLGIDDVMDGRVLLANALNAQEIQLSERGIEDITGISAFENLLFIDFHGNNLSFIPEDLPAGLEVLKIAENCYSALDVSYLTNLVILQVGSCLEALDISMLTRLEQFDVFSGSPALACITANEDQINKAVECELPNDNGYIWCYDPFYTVLTADCNAYLNAKTYIPDDAFESYLIERGIDDVLDDYVLTHLLVNIEFLNMDNRGIRSIEGIQDFPNLIGLNLLNNEITGIINLENNTHLEGLDVAENPFNELILNNHPKLKYVYAYHTYTMEVLEIGNSPLLEQLAIHNAFISSLDLTAFPELKYLRAWDNNFTTIDVSQNPNLIELWVDGLEQSTLDLSNNPDLKELTINNSDLTTIDLYNNLNLEFVHFSMNKFLEVDLSMLTQLKDLRLDNNSTNESFGLTPPPPGDTLEGISLYNLQLTSFNFNNYPNLTSIYAPSNQFDTIDVSGLNQLEVVLLDNNQINTISLPSQAPLKHLLLQGNQLTAIDVTPFPTLNVLLLENNQLSSLDISSINQLNFFTISNNVSLTCITVNEAQLDNPLDCEDNRDVGYDELTRWCKDENQFYALNCN